MKNHNLIVPIINKRGKFLVLLIFSFIMFFLHIYKLNYQSLWMDEGFYLLAAKNILKFGYPLYPSGYILFKSIFYSYLLAGFSFLFGQSVFVYRLLSVIVYIISPLIVFKLTEEYINKNILLISGIIYYLFSWETEFSRTALYYSLLQLLFTVSVITFINRTILNKKSKYYIFWILSSFTHQLSISLGFLFPSLLVVKPKLFLKRKNIISMFFWGVFFLFIILQEVLFWKVGQVYSNQSISKCSVKGAINYFFSTFNFVYFKLLYKTHPYSFPLFLVGTILLIVFVLYKKLYLKENLKVQTEIMAIIILTLFLTLFFLGFMRTHPMPRYLFPFHFLYLIIIVYFLFVIIKFFGRYIKIVNNENVTLFILFFTSFLIVSQANIKQKIDIITRDYDDPVTTDIIRRSGRFYPIDHQSLGVYVKHNIKKDDIVIAIHMVFQYLYVGRVNYWLFSGGPGTWDAWEKVNGKWRDFYLGSEWINSLAKLQKIINGNNSNGKRVWIITSPSEDNIAHINNNIRNFLKNNSDKVVWISRDGIGKVYLFTPENKKFRFYFYKAIWGIYKNNIKTIKNKNRSVLIDKKHFYKTALIFSGKKKTKIKLIFDKQKESKESSKIMIQIARDGEIEKTSFFILRQESEKTLILKFKNQGRYNLKFKLIKGSPVYFKYIEL